MDDEVALDMSSDVFDHPKLVATKFVMNLQRIALSLP